VAEQAEYHAAARISRHRAGGHHDGSNDHRAPAVEPGLGEPMRGARIRSAGAAAAAVRAEAAAAAAGEDRAVLPAARADLRASARTTPAAGAGGRRPAARGSVRRSLPRPARTRRTWRAGLTRHT